MEMKPYRLCMVLSHPIHYYVPLFKILETSPAIDLTVLYCSDAGVRKDYCPEFGATYQFDTPLLDGYRFEFIKNISPWSSVFHFWGLVNPGLLKQISRGQYDAVMVMGWGHLSMLIAILAARLSGTSVFMHGDSAPIYPLPWLKRLAKQCILRMLFRCVDAFLVCGTLNKLFYQQYGADPGRMFLTPWAVDNEFFIRESDRFRIHRAVLRRELNLAPNSTVVIFVGKMVQRKRPFDLVLAVEKLVAEGEQVSLLFVGIGPDKERIEEYTRRRGLSDVHFLGFVNQSEIPKLYAVADVFALPSEMDPRGTVTNEAMACGLPIIISDRVGVWGDGDIVRHGENGYVFQFGRSDLLIGYLRDLARHEDKRKAMGDRSREIIRDWNHHRFGAGLLEALKYVSVRTHVR
jgi:glycosyltransferase involved in cell wall biosynthesis